MSVLMFPKSNIDHENPAIQLFGSRFFIDQKPMEILLEFLLVAFSPKRLGQRPKFETALPALEELQQWQDSPLHYAPKARLNLKLFALLANSRLDTRHPAHRQQHQRLEESLEEKIKIYNDSSSKGEVVNTLKNLLLGFQGVGAGRTWCTQSFLPLSQGLLAGETILEIKKAKKSHHFSWQELISNRGSHFSFTKHDFLARGGELLYLQICNALRRSPEEIAPYQEAWSLTPEESQPALLQKALEQALQSLMQQCPSPVTELAKFIDEALDQGETAAATDLSQGEPRYLEAGFCPQDSWPEGYLFAVELCRLCQAEIDVMDRLYLLECACVMQALRSLIAQSVRVMAGPAAKPWPGYWLVVSAPSEERPFLKRLSQHSVKTIEKQIYSAIRKRPLPESEAEAAKLLKEADGRYGGKLLLLLAKNLGLIVPRRGEGARFVLNSQILRYLVMTAVLPGTKVTFERFKKIVEARHGLVFDAEGCQRAQDWSGYGGEWHLDHSTDHWVQGLLEEAGLLIPLSDSHTLVHNPTRKSF